jgi:hypothetical protein
VVLVSEPWTAILDDLGLDRRHVAERRELRVADESGAA